MCLCQLCQVRGVILIAIRTTAIAIAVIALLASLLSVCENKIYLRSACACF